MKALKISENIYWVGAIDWNVRNFHGYETEKGTTYNAYLILDERITLIDTVKETLQEEMLERISSVIDPAKIDVIISNHSEPDHSGALPFILRYALNATVFAVTPAGEKDLSAYYGALPCQGVKTGDKLSIGKHEFSFISTPMVHWPDNMVCHMTPENILFSNDAFGQHYASTTRFDTDSNLPEVFKQSKKYYANIVQPYGLQTNKALAACEKLNISMICPSHGVIWTDHIPEILKSYRQWTAGKQYERAVIVYDTMWHSTELIAHALETAFTDCNIPVKLCDLKHENNSDIIAELLDARYLAVGSPTLNNNMMPSIAGFLTYFKGLNGNQKKFIAFGSYGWGGQSIQQVYDFIASCKCEALLPPVKQLYKPTPQELDKIAEYVTAALKQ